MRLFVAIDFDKETKQKIFEFQSELKKLSIKGRWKYIDNFHLTLKFLGEVDLQKLDILNMSLKKVSSDMKKFIIKISDIGRFGDKKIIRVIWLGIDETGELSLLNEKIEQELNKIGFEKEKRKYRPHVTIAQDVLLNTDFENIKSLIKKFRFKEFVVDRFILMKSEQIDNKRVYTPISEYYLV